MMSVRVSCHSLYHHVRLGFQLTFFASCPSCWHQVQRDLAWSCRYSNGQQPRCCTPQHGPCTTASRAQPVTDPCVVYLQFVLGTESGMITSIVRKVQAMLRDSGRTDLEVEIVFPVSPESITTTNQTTASSGGPVLLPGGLSIIPGPASGEGCSTEGGCASCPYMKMNSLM